MEPTGSDGPSTTTTPRTPEPRTGTPSRGWSDPYCPVARAVDIVGDRWTLLVLRDALDGTRSFTDFHRNLGVAKNILTDRLRRLTDHGVLRRQTAPTGRRQEYVLTDAGQQLFTAIVALGQWGQTHAFEPHERHSVRVDDDTATEVPTVQVTRTDGTTLTAANTHVRSVT